MKKNEDLQLFGDWLRQTRKAKGFTQEGLAKAAGDICTGAYISSLERQQDIGKNGRATRPDINIVDALARALEVPLSIARIAAGYAPPSPDPTIDAQIEDAFARALFYKHNKLSKSDKDKIRPLLEMISREIDRLKSK